MLSTTTEYALRAMVELARCPEGESCLGRGIAERAEIPSNYLSKILLDLKNRGYVSAVRGTGGGYRLRRPASEIRLIDVVEVFDPPRAHPRCLLYGDHECSEDAPCAAHERWGSVRDAWVRFLETTTLEEVARQPRLGSPARTGP